MNFEGRVWSVVSGPCTIDSDDCILSPGYPENYGNNQQCKAGAVSLEAFGISCRWPSIRMPWLGFTS